MASTSAPKSSPEAAAPASATQPSAEPVFQPDVLPPSKVTSEFNVLCYTLLSLFIVSFAAWLIYAWTGYGNRYAPHADGWYKGGTRSIEVTLVREDVQNLTCASDAVLEGLHCGFRANQQPFDAQGTEDRLQLRPYYTADQTLFLGAGMWSSPGLSGTLPKDRFSVVCNYRMVGSLKSVSLRWQPTGSFAPVKDTVPVGLLTECVIPQ
jgi:hypothetical protein